MRHFDSIFVLQSLISPAGAKPGAKASKLEISRPTQAGTAPGARHADSSQCMYQQ